MRGSSSFLAEPKHQVWDDVGVVFLGHARLLGTRRQLLVDNFHQAVHRQESLTGCLGGEPVRCRLVCASGTARGSQMTPTMVFQL